MARLQDVPSADRRRFNTGRLCLDAIHTGGRGEHARWEVVEDARSLAFWLGVVVEADVRARLSDVEPFKDLREALAALAYGAAAGESPAAGAVAVVNAFASAPPLVPVLGAPKAGSTTTVVVDPALGVALAPGTAAQACSTLARDAIDLFGSPLRERIRVCAAENCGLLLLDTSRPGSRRWCSMDVCGNRSKVRAHRAAASMRGR